MKTVSIIIPAINEEVYLPGLLGAIRRQTRPPLEIIVADAGSSDRTIEIALRVGCRLVPGGRPARGRNAGAAAARGDLLLFLDADVLPTPDFLARALEEFDRRGLDAATCPVKPLGGNLVDAIFHEAANVFIQATSTFNPHAPGFCILSRRQMHASIGGFDEALYLSEDHDYVRRVVAQGGRFGILHVPIPVSIRRVESDGRWNVAVRYSFLAVNQMIGEPFNQALLDRYLGEYRFAHHSPAATRSQARLNIDFQPIGRATPSPIRQAVNTAHQQTYQLIDHCVEGRKALDNLFRSEMPAALRVSSLAVKKDVKDLAGRKDALSKQTQK
ncbi:MAG: glycosyltransferase [Anaerolineales bacterium]|nr:glycosyltransferase [Anaerolineales bacterium]